MKEEEYKLEELLGQMSFDRDTVSYKKACKERGALAPDITNVPKVYLVSKQQK